MKYLATFFSAFFGLMACMFILVTYQTWIGMSDLITIPIVLEGTIKYYSAFWYLVGQEISGPVFSIAFICMFCLCISWRHKLSKKKKDTLDIKEIKGPFVLYLRSFKDDAVTRKKVSFSDIRSEEEMVVEMMSDIAPVYAIGDPKDKKMPLGASRIYVDDEHWKDVVTQMMQRAEVVVLRLGATDSFWWEVETALESIPLGKLLFVIPRNKSFDNVAMLYKIMFEHNIDIKDLNITIEKKRQGSISSFVFFDNENTPVTAEIFVPRFTRMVLSYENILRNALPRFMAKFGLDTKHRRSVKIARIVQIAIIFFLLFMGGARAFSDYVSLKYQMPYELVEQCIEDPSFVSKYSERIDAANLARSLYEAKCGSFALDDEDYIMLNRIELQTMVSMSEDEIDHIGEKPKNLLLMVKNYHPDCYDDYVKLLSKAALYSIHYPDETKDLIRHYQLGVEDIPQWVVELGENGTRTVKEQVRLVVSHIEDDGISELLKTLAAQEMKLD